MSTDWRISVRTDVSDGYLYDHQSSRYVFFQYLDGSKNDCLLLPSKVTNSASRWRKIAKNLPQDLIHYTITITWFLTDSHTKVTSPRTARKKAAQNLRLHIIRIRHCDECICRWVWSFAQLGCSRRSRNIFCHVASPNPRVPYYLEGRTSYVPAGVVKLLNYRHCKNSR